MDDVTLLGVDDDDDDDEVEERVGVEVEVAAGCGCCCGCCSDWRPSRPCASSADSSSSSLSSSSGRSSKKLACARGVAAALGDGDRANERYLGGDAGMAIAGGT